MDKRGKVVKMIKKTVSLVACVMLAAGLLSGCAKTLPTPKQPVFFPPAPADPHVQYLTGIKDSSDIEEAKSNFSVVMTGKEKGNVIKRIIKGYGVTAKNGKLYVTSQVGSQVVVIDIMKKSFEFLKGATEGPGKLLSPINTALDKDGNLYVADSVRNEVVIYGPDGSFLRTMGKVPKNEEGKKRTVVSVAIYDDQVYILDSKASDIRVLDRNTGDELKVMGKEGKGSLGLPTNMTFDKDGYLWITNIGRSNVTKYDRDGHFITSFGRAGDTPGSFTRPKGIAADDEGWLYVVDAGWGNVQVFANDGKDILGYFGTPATPEGSLNLPAGIAVSKDNLEYFQQFAAPGFILDKIVYVVNQATNDFVPAISVYGVGEMKDKREAAAKKKEAAGSGAKPVQK